MFGLSTIKLIGMGVGILAVIGLLAMVNGWRVKMTQRGEQLAVQCQATRDATNQPKLDCKQVPAQIKFMGEAIGTLSAALDKQNAAVKAMDGETRRQAAELTEAKKQADKRAEKPLATSERLDASSRSGERQAKPCEPSKVLQESWR